MGTNSNIVVKGRTKGAALALFIAEIDEQLAYYTGRVLVSINLKRHDTGWILVLTANFKVTKQVTFITGEELIDCYRQLYRLMYAGRLSWHKSKY